MSTSAFEIRPAADEFELPVFAAGHVDAGSGASSGSSAEKAPRRLTLGVLLSIIWVVFVILIALGAYLVPLADPNASITPTTTPPFRNWPEFLGTDQLGRSVTSRLVYGARVSLVVSVAAVTLGLVVGTAAGMIASMHRGANHVVSVLADVVLAFPGVLLLITLSAVLNAGEQTLVIGLTLLSLPAFVRLARANADIVKHREYVEAARLIGTRPIRLLMKEMLPSVIRPVLAYAVVVLATLMIAEASLSFLGLGVVPPKPSWGGMIAAGQPQLGAHRELVFVPAVVLCLTVFSLGVLGRWLQSRLSAK